MRLILASSSPRRARILDFLGIPFRQIDPKGVDETALPGENPRSLVRRLAIAKASTLSSRFPNALVLGADTMVVRGRKSFGKPRDKKEAGRMIRGFSGGWHFVLTGVALAADGGRKIETHVEKTKVWFRKITGPELKRYLATREPYDKAGGYDIQGTAGQWVSGLDGDYFNVMGLPTNWILSRVNAGPEGGRIIR
jgi:septum formation protein